MGTYMENKLRFEKEKYFAYFDINHSLEVIELKVLKWLPKNKKINKMFQYIFVFFF